MPADVDDVRIVPTAEEHVEGFHRCVDAVARERRYLALVESPPLAASRAFVQSVITGGGVHLVAVDASGRVVGWCDIVRDSLEGFRHRAHLGMGLLPEARGRGLGRALATAALDRARELGLERIELEVFASNTNAIALYERLGFVHEGTKRRARFIDGAYDDGLFMALMLDPAER